MTKQADELIRTETAVKVAGGGGTEGPVWHPSGHLIFVRMATKEVVRWDRDGGERVVRAESGKATGCTLDAQGRLVMCESDTRQVTRMHEDGTIETLHADYQGRRLNKPNDLICAADGTIYFTDPQTSVPEEQRELGFSAVFRIGTDNSLSLVTDAVASPNGLALSPDGRRLYVANSKLDSQCDEAIAHGEICTHRSIYATDFDGERWSTAEVFASLASSGRGVPDGIKVDSDGRVYCGCAGFIWILEPAGDLVGKVSLPEAPPRNFAFGEADFSTLFVAAGQSIYTVQTSVTGLPGTPFGRPA